MNNKILRVFSLIYIAFIVLCALTSCDENNQTKVSEKVNKDEILSSNMVNMPPDSNDNKESEPSCEIFSSPIGVKTIHHDTGGEEVFINDIEGWRIYHIAEECKSVLCKTMDRGDNWSEVTNSDIEFEPIGMDTANGCMYISGMTFLSSNIGWITTYKAEPGYIGLYKTSDGGRTWSLQNLNISDRYKESEFDIKPPVFFSQMDGVFLTVAHQGGQLAFITHDGGNTWIETAKKTDDINLQWDVDDINLQWDVKETNHSVWEVNYKNIIWQSSDRLNWVKNEPL